MVVVVAMNVLPRSGRPWWILMVTLCVVSLSKVDAYSSSSSLRVGGLVVGNRPSIRDGASSQSHHGVLGRDARRGPAMPPRFRTSRPPRPSDSGLSFSTRNHEEQETAHNGIVGTPRPMPLARSAIRRVRPRSSFSSSGSSLFSSSSSESLIPFSVIAPDDAWGNWMMLIFNTALAQYMTKTTAIGRLLGPPIGAMFWTFFMATVGILPSGGSPAAASLQALTLYLATPLVLLGVANDFRRRPREEDEPHTTHATTTSASSPSEPGRRRRFPWNKSRNSNKNTSSNREPMYTSFALAACATLVASIMGYGLLRPALTAAMGADDALKIVAALMARNIGGGLNYIAVCTTLQASPMAITAGMCADNIFGLCYFPIISYLAMGRPDPAIEEQQEERQEQEEKRRHQPLAQTLELTLEPGEASTFRTTMEEPQLLNSRLSQKLSRSLPLKASLSETSTEEVGPIADVLILNQDEVADMDHPPIHPPPRPLQGHRHGGGGHEQNGGESSSNLKSKTRHHHLSSKMNGRVNGRTTKSLNGHGKIAKVKMTRRNHHNSHSENERGANGTASPVVSDSSLSSSTQPNEAVVTGQDSSVTVDRMMYVLFTASILVWLSQLVGGARAALPVCTLLSVLLIKVVTMDSAPSWFFGAPRWLPAANRWIASIQPTAQMLGTVALHIFFSTLGAQGGRAVSTLKSSMIPLGAFLGILYVLHGTWLLALRRVFPHKRSMAVPRLLIASSAAIGGPATAVALAQSNSWKSLQVPGLLAGNVGDMMGTFLGIAFFGLFSCTLSSAGVPTP